MNRKQFATALVALSLWPAAATLQQPAPGAAPPPALKWNEDQIKQAVAPSRVGRRLKPKTWPNGARVAVSLSFDIDNEYLTRPQLLPGPLSQGEYGAVQGLPRVLALMDSQQIPASFYVPAVELHQPSGHGERDPGVRPPRDRAARLDS